MSADLDFSLAAMRRPQLISVEERERRRIEALIVEYAIALHDETGMSIEAAMVAARQVDFGRAVT